MTNTHALRPSTHGDDYPPSRPGVKTLIVAVVLLVGAGFLWWPAISAFVRL